MSSCDWFIDRTGDYNLREKCNNKLLLLSLHIKNNILIKNENKFNEDNFECCICMNYKQNFQICQLNCRHKFCIQCIYKTIRSKKITCPLCRSEIEEINCNT